MKTIAYTYYLYHEPTGQKYYGVRYSKKCHPSDLWFTYFSSSQTVADLIEEYGIDSFKFEVRKTFNSIDKARKWEQKVLWRLKVVRRRDWINKSYGTGWTDHATMGMLGKKHSEETKAKMKISQTKEKNGFYGKTHTAESRNKISNASSSRTHTIETKKKISLNRNPNSNSSFLNKTHSIESRNKIKSSLLGVKHSEERKKNISEAHKGYKHYTDGVVNKQFRDNDIIPLNFMPGRTINKRNSI